MPEALIEQLRSIYGFDEEAFVNAQNGVAVTSVRMHAIKSKNYIKPEKTVPWSVGGYYLQHRPVFTLDPYYHAGAYYVQEASSMFIGQIWKQFLADKKNIRVLDLCAAPGGKSTLIADLIDKDSLLISNEVIRSRASILEENITRWGYNNTWVTSNDPKSYGALKNYFDVIVIDAPCSGSGLFRKDARAINEWSIDNVNLCAARQERIIEDVWDSLKQGGMLIYATCSFSPQEDEQILDKIAALGAENVKVSIDSDWGIIESMSVNNNYGYRFFPDKLDGEGFFAGVFIKSTDADERKGVKFRSENNKQLQLSTSVFFTNPEELTYLSYKDNNFAINKQHEVDFQELSKMLYFRQVGVRLGEPSAKEWLPDHHLALSVDLSENIQHVNVDVEDALRFLKRENMEIQMPDRKGWYVVKYNGLGLGWIKNIGNRVNNYLPKHWRIRMEIPDMDRE